MTHGVCGCRGCREIDAARMVADRLDAIERATALDDWLVEHDGHYWTELPPDHETDLMAPARGWPTFPHPVRGA